MYIETKSADELTKLLDERGYSSLEARGIQKEMELVKEQYDLIIRCGGTLDECENGTAAMVMKYYMRYLSRLQQPYDAMGSQTSISMIALQEFGSKDIVEQICKLIEANQSYGIDGFKHEVQKFKTVQLDPKGIILYIDILRGQVPVW